MITRNAFKFGSDLVGELIITMVELRDGALPGSDGNVAVVSDGWSTIEGWSTVEGWFTWVL